MVVSEHGVRACIRDSDYTASMLYVCARELHCLCLLSERKHSVCAVPSEQLVRKRCTVRVRQQLCLCRGQHVGSSMRVSNKLRLFRGFRDGRMCAVYSVQQQRHVRIDRVLSND
jgi:hypothetical protein